MSQSKELLEAARLKQRINTMINQVVAQNYNINDLRNQRNRASQVRNLAGSVGGARFGQSNGSNTVGP